MEQRLLRFPPEFKLAIACCADAIGAARVPEELVGAVDGNRFLATVERHRIDGLAHRALAPFKALLPARVSEMLEAGGRRVAEEGLRAAVQCKQLREALAEHEIDVLFLKGLAVGKLAFGSALAKRSWDIDILVAEPDVERAAGVLEKLGYRCPVGAVGRWHRRHKETGWFNDKLAPVELHSRLADNRRLILDIGMRSPRQTIQVLPGIELQTIAGDHLLAYLAVHGASSAWFRLKWITEFAGLLRGCSAHAIAATARNLQELGAGRAAGQALLLSSWLFGSPVPPGISQDSKVHALARLALAQLANEREPTERLLGTATIHLSQLLLSSGRGFAVNEGVRQVRELLDRRFKL